LRTLTENRKNQQNWSESLYLFDFINDIKINAKNNINNNQINFIIYIVINKVIEIIIYRIVNQLFKIKELLLRI
jgi:hypothetical protein